MTEQLRTYLASIDDQLDAAGFLHLPDGQVATYDQLRSRLRDEFAEWGLDINDPTVAAAGYVAIMLSTRVAVGVFGQGDPRSIGMSPALAAALGVLTRVCSDVVRER